MELEILNPFGKDTGTRVCFRLVDLWQILDLKHKIETRFLFCSITRKANVVIASLSYLRAPSVLSLGWGLKEAG